MICKRCGKTFNKAEERRIFDHYNQSSGWRYDTDTPGNLCSECAQDYCEDSWMWGEKSAKDGPPPDEAIDKFAKLQVDIYNIVKKHKRPK